MRRVSISRAAPERELSLAHLSFAPSKERCEFAGFLKAAICRLLKAVSPRRQADKFTKLLSFNFLWLLKP